MWLTQGWYKRNAITAMATVVEVGVPKNAAQSQTQPVTLDIRDPSGETLRLEGWLSTWSHGSIFSAGETVRVRYSPEKRTFTDYVRMTVPKEEWLADLNQSSQIQVEPGAPVGAVQVINTSGADPATVSDKLGRLRELGLMSEAQLAQAQQQLDPSARPIVVSDSSQTSGPADALEVRLTKLDQLRADGILDDDEYASQRQRILDSL